MVALTELKFSKQLIEKLNSKGINEFSELESSLIRAESAITPDVSLTTIAAIGVKKAEGVKKLKDSRSPRILCLVESQEVSDNLISEMNSLLTKCVVTACHEGKSLKKNKKALVGPIDIIVGTCVRINELIDTKYLKTNKLKTVLITDLDKIVATNEKYLRNIMESLKSNLDASLNESSGNADLQIITKGKSNLSMDFMNDILNKKFLSINPQSESSESEEESESESEEEKESKKVESKKDSEDESESEVQSEEVKEKPIKVESKNGSEESSDDDSVAESEEVSVGKTNGDVEMAEIKEESRDYEIDNDLIKKISNVQNFEKYTEMAKLLLEKHSDLETLSKCLVLLSSSTNKSKTTVTNGKPTPVFSGEGSKLTGREGYTAYHLTTINECYSKGYAYKTLKRLINEESVERMERLQMQKDSKGFVFDLPSELDSDFQNNWLDGKYDTLKLLENEIPDLQEYDDANKPSGGRGGRGGFRGGRGNDRGQRRGGRGGYDRGFKRGGDAMDGGNSKVQKFD